MGWLFLGDHGIGHSDRLFLWARFLFMRVPFVSYRAAYSFKLKIDFSKLEAEFAVSRNWGVIW